MSDNYHAISPWKPSSALTVSDNSTDIRQIVAAAIQLRKREQGQIISNLEAGSFEVAATYVWHRSVTLLKKQLSSLGNTFISELLQRPDINEFSDLVSEISTQEAISLAKDLGIVTQTQAMRLIHSQEIIAHFSSIEGDEVIDESEGMTPEEAIGCVRVCVQGVLGHERISVAEDFATFRTRLETETFTNSSPEIFKLNQSPYLFVRTALSVLLATIRTGKGSTLEHASRNARVIVPILWPNLKNPERWQVGQVYASEFNEGRKDVIQALYAVLTTVKGFDYVPENLRSNTFTKVAGSVISAHQAVDNFYKEPGPIRELANLGTSIPGPAVAACITATLCVRLGNSYGVSWAAQDAAQAITSGISEDRWIYYLDGVLSRDLIILSKLSSNGSPLDRWFQLLEEIVIDADMITHPAAKRLVRASVAKNKAAVTKAAQEMIGSN